MKRMWIPVALLVLAPPIGCNRGSKTIENGQLFVSGAIDGDTVDISSKVDGKILDMLVREGDSVEAGQPVARLVSPQNEARVDAQQAVVADAQQRLKEAESAAPARVAVAEANLASSRAELARWEAELEQAEANAKRYPPLVPTGAISEQRAEQEETRAKIARASTEASRKQVLAADASLKQAKAQLEQINTARANLESSRAVLKVDQENVNDLMIAAPISGVILIRAAEPGRVVQAGQTILTMVDVQKLYMRGYVPLKEIERVKLGQQAEVFLDSNPKQAIPAEVIRIDPRAVFTPQNIYFRDDLVKEVVIVKLGLRGAYGFAKPGMPADGHIQIGPV